ncbi:MAG: YybH family protein [Candidatus Hodarchaeota archaeon]
MKTVDIEAEKKEILRHMEELEAAENRKDLEGILELLTEDFVFVQRSAKYEGIVSTREWLERLFQTYISSKHVPLRVEVSSSGDMAWLLGYEINERERNEGIVETRGDYLVTFRKVEGKWKQVAVCLA